MSLTHLKPMDMQALNKAQQSLHQAVQFIAIAGAHLSPPKDDDSHTNMAWDTDSESFVGNLINNRAAVALHVPSFSLKIFGPSNLELASLELHGKKREECLHWLSMALQLKQIDTEQLNLDMHYEIPDHPVMHGAAFEKADDELLSQLSIHRSIADRFAKQLLHQHEHASEARTWPHHFDHGTYIPFKFEEDDAIQSISFGYAIADSLIDEPYFYSTQWIKDGELDYDGAPELKAGKWYPKGLKGAALAISEVFHSTDAEKTIQAFLDTTTEWGLNS